MKLEAIQMKNIVKNQITVNVKIRQIKQWTFRIKLLAIILKFIFQIGWIKASIIYVGEINEVES